MNGPDASPRPPDTDAAAAPRSRFDVMPRLTHEQMLAILRESGVPESEARRWVAHEAALAARES